MQSNKAINTYSQNGLSHEEIAYRVKQLKQKSPISSEIDKNTSGMFSMISSSILEFLKDTENRNQVINSVSKDFKPDEKSFKQVQPSGRIIKKTGRKF